MNELINVKIETKDGVNVVSSRVIANQLGKEHKHVLEGIRRMGLNLDPCNFIEISYLDSYNRSKTEYLLTKDGFTLYMFNIQGYNEFKRAYINRFNEMEKAFIFFLIDKKYIYRDQKGTLKPVAKYVGTYFELKEWVRGEKTGTQTLITAKGKEQFLELINSIKL